MSFFSNSKNNRRKYFLLDSNQTVRHKPKIFRNRFLNIITKIVLLKPFLGIFRISTFLSAVCFLMMGFILFAVFSPYFSIKKINILRDDPNINVEAIDQELQAVYGKNLIFLDQEALKKKLLEKFPAFNTLEIQEIWPSELELRPQLSLPKFTLLNDFDAAFSVISEKGVILAQKPEKDLPVIKIVGYKKNLVPGMKFLEKDVLEKVEKTKSLFLDPLKINISEIRILPIAREIHVVSDSGTVFWIDYQQNLEEQIEKISLAAKKMKLSSVPIEHVDLRIPNQIFWKPSKNPLLGK